MYANAEAAGVSLVASEARPGHLPLGRAFCSLPRQVRRSFVAPFSFTQEPGRPRPTAITAVIRWRFNRPQSSSTPLAVEVGGVVHLGHYSTGNSMIRVTYGSSYKPTQLGAELVEL